jgi:hypothetical protein
MKPALLLTLSIVCLVGSALPVAAQENTVTTGSFDGRGPATQWTMATPVGLAISREAARFAAAADHRPSTLKAVLQNNKSAKSKSVPMLIGLGVGAAVGFFVGSHLEHSMCEWNCPAGGMTWGFTGLGAAGGAGLGWLAGHR